MTADELRAWRIDRGMSQPQVGRLLKLTGRTVRNYELGATPIPFWVATIIAKQRKVRIVK